jgi:hypothetical protein
MMENTVNGHKLDGNAIAVDAYYNQNIVTDNAMNILEALSNSEFEDIAQELSDCDDNFDYAAPEDAVLDYIVANIGLFNPDLEER